MAIGLAHEEAPPASAEPPTPPRRKRHPLATGIAVALVLVVAGLVGWVAFRGYLARQELKAALPAAEDVQSQIVAGDLAAARTDAASLKKHAAAAASLTSDPIWRAAEIVPWIGPSLIAVRTVAASTDTVASEVVVPMVRVAEAADPRTLKIAAGRIDVAPLVAVQPDVEKAQAAFHRADDALGRVDAGAAIPPVSAAVERLRGYFATATPAIDAVGNTARLLPVMLGADGPRTYLVVAQNPAELRATGGLIGSVVRIQTDRGSIAITGQEAGTSIGPWENSLVDLPNGPAALYGSVMGRYIQDVNLTPDFALAASTASTMWTSANGGTVDGVIAVDPVVLSALLRVTGPVATAGGRQLTADNAVPMLLSWVYQDYPDSNRQDAFFASAAAAVFQRVADGGVDGAGLIGALAASGASRRILIWSAHPAEQSILASTSLAGGLPISTDDTAGVGVYFNDGTGAKMDYYLATSVSAGSAVCRADGTPTTRVQVTLTNRAPADAGSTLPTYVTGGGRFGPAPGSILTRVAVYGPAGGLLAATTTGDRTKTSTVTAVDQGRPVSVYSVTLAPGEHQTVDVDFLALRQKGTGVSVAMTPTLPGDGRTPEVGSVPEVGSLAIDCASVVK